MVGPLFPSLFRDVLVFDFSQRIVLFGAAVVHNYSCFGFGGNGKKSPCQNPAEGISGTIPVTLVHEEGYEHWLICIAASSASPVTTNEIEDFSAFFKGLLPDADLRIQSGKNDRLGERLEVYIIASKAKID